MPTRCRRAEPLPSLRIMAIVNEFGRPYQTPYRFAHAADRSPVHGPQYATRRASIDELIPPSDRQTLVSLSQRLYTNKGVLRACIDQKAEYSIGNAYLPEYLGSDVEPGDRAEQWLQNVWFPNCDVRGGVFDFNQLLLISSRAIDREGEAFWLLTETQEKGFPLIQQIASHRVRSNAREDVVESGSFKGARIHDGLIKNKRERVIAYRVYSGQDKFRDIPAAQIIHVFNPSYQEQGRGLPSFTHALDDLKHCLQSTEDERRRQGILSGLGLIVSNEMGGPDLSDPSVTLGDGMDNGTVEAYENTNGIYYLTANAGEKLEQIKHDSPGEVWESFHDRMIREAIAGVGWSYSLAWKPAGQGTAERGEILRARRAIESRQKILDHLAKRAVTYALSYAIEQGAVDRLQAPLSWRFTRPPRLSVDDGREAKAMNEAYRLGRTNLRDLLEADGKTLEGHYAARIDEIVKRKLAIAEAEAAHPGVQIDEREMVMLTANEPAEEHEEPNQD